MSCTTKSTDRLLIELYKNNPILWDTRLDEYKLSELKPAVWAKIGADCRLSGNDAQKKISSIRSSYRRVKKTFLDQGKLKKPRLYKYSDDLSFLDDVITLELPLAVCESTDDNIGLELSPNGDSEDDGTQEQSFSGDNNTNKRPRTEERKAVKKEVGVEWEEDEVVRDIFYKVSASMGNLQQDSLQHRPKPHSLPTQLHPPLAPPPTPPVPMNMIDGDYGFCADVYNDLKEMPNGRTKDLLKVDLKKLIFDFKYGREDSLSARSNGYVSKNSPL